MPDAYQIDSLIDPRQQVWKSPNSRGLGDFDGSFLVGPQQRKFYPFGQSLGGKLRRLTTGGYGSDDLGSQKRQPQQSSHVTRSDAFVLRNFSN